MSERRRAARKPFRVYFNKYIAGHPHLSRTVDVSTTGILVDTLLEPRDVAPSFAIELTLPGEREPAWLWVRSVGRRGGREALSFVNLGARDQARLRRFVAQP